MGLSPKQWDSVKELYEVALEYTPPRRDAFLQKKAKDEVVREEVRRLLAEHDHLGSFLSAPPFIDPRLSSTNPPERLAPGEVLSGRFRVINFVAAGGMGEVYKAEDQRLERSVVLKFLPKGLAEDAQSLERFRCEAKAASALNHPNICTVYDFGEDTGRTFIAMEYLEGETLSARIKKGPLPLDEALKIALAMASALVAAHHRGIIHRDVKPGNIMVTDTGAKLLDFGLAKHEQPVGSDEQTRSVLIGEAQVVGTLPYMSPEQLQGKEGDARGDIFAFGAVLYEMLTGNRAFQRRSSSETIAAVSLADPRPLHQFVQDVPDELEAIVRRCLRKNPDERYASMSEIERELEYCFALTSESRSGINLKVLLRRSRESRVAIPALLIVLLVVSGISWWIHHNSRVSWARDKAVPQIAQLIEMEKLGEAYALAVKAERYISHDPVLVKIWPKISWSTPISSIPSGVSVFQRRYDAPENQWEFVGKTPLNSVRFPLVDSRWKFELNGYATVERATFPADSMTVKMDKSGVSPSGMIRVDLADSADGVRKVWLRGLSGYENLPAIPIGNYWIDKFEVTNREFKQFVDQGGYQKPEYWRYPLVKDHRPLSWPGAMKLFQDRTGRPGPATWTLGEYPRGQDDYPVMGISWFEAAAYAEFSGKQLPTVYHWIGAAYPPNGSSIIPFSNFGGVGVAPAGQYQGMTWSGALDMAGNVKEWVLNEARNGTHYILGGAWNEPAYMFYNADARSPFERSANFGFRCAKYVLTGEQTKSEAPVPFQVRNYESEKPVSDQVFTAYKSLYSYDKTPLHPVIEVLPETDDWKEEKVTFDAAYGNERIIAYVFLPKHVSPPFQTVVHFNGGAAFYWRSSDPLDRGFLQDFDFLIKSGRAVIFPVYKGTFERWDDFMSWPKSSSFYRDGVIAWSKDLGRSIDYLETRFDIDTHKLAYEGTSMGAAEGALLAAMENRLKVLVLVSPGFYLQKRLPEADQLNFVPRVKAPVLMLNGNYDYIFPVRASQEPMFRLLGTPADQKRRVVYDTGHDIPRNEMIKESLNWLDRYLGPVK